MDSPKKNSLFFTVKNFLTTSIWNPYYSEKKGLAGFGVVLLRIIVTTINGILKNRVFVQASSLSYATLLAIGPILAITILFSGIFFRDKGEKFIYGKILDAATFVMPAVAEMMPPANTDSGSVSKINPVVFKFINNISKGSVSGGAIGVATMLVTCLLLCKNMESSINLIWGARKGRKWVDRIVFYFSMIFFGSVGTIFGMTFLATSQLSSFVGGIPIISDYASWLTYLIGMAVMTVVLASFYKFFPCARVKWKAALVGGFIIMLMLMLNNKLSFIYIGYIVKQQNLYGYLAIVAVAMFSLYIFWLVILSGSQITYAVQYMDFLSDDDAWNAMGPRMRALCGLAAFAEISREFCLRDGIPTQETLSSKLKLPSAAVAASLDILSDKGFVCKVLTADTQEYAGYKPSVPPESVTLSRFFEEWGYNQCDKPSILSHSEPAVAEALKSIDEYAGLDISKKTIKDLI